MKFISNALFPGFLILFFCGSFSFMPQQFETKASFDGASKAMGFGQTLQNDSIQIEGKYIFKLYKKGAHASYYADKFTGRKTASGAIFDNKKYTAAHKKLPFGTKVRVTNEANGKSTMVTVNDRGPFTKGREIDLSKAAFRDIARHHGYGSMKVTIEIVEEIKQP